jgi:hypothetical protein
MDHPVDFSLRSPVYPVMKSRFLPMEGLKGGSSDNDR